MKILVIFLICILLVGCETLRKGEHRDIDCRVLGLDASVPIPFANNVNILNIRLGWVETTYSHGYKTIKYSVVNHDINYLGASERIVYFGLGEEKEE